MHKNCTIVKASNWLATTVAVFLTPFLLVLGQVHNDAPAVLRVGAALHLNNKGCKGLGHIGAGLCTRQDEGDMHVP